MKRICEIPFELCECQDTCPTFSRRTFFALIASVAAAAAYAHDSSSFPTKSDGEDSLVFIDWPLL